MTIRKIQGIVCAIGLMIFFAAPFAEAGAVLADLENALMCKCDDKCGKVLINCTCSTSDKTRAEFAGKLASGITMEQIIQEQVDKYGETVLSAPSKSGFNLTAWVAPFVALIAGGFGIRKIIDTWIKKNSNEESEPSDAPEGPVENKISSMYAQRLKKELDEIEQ